MSLSDFPLTNVVVYVPLFLFAAFYAFRTLADLYILVRFGETGALLQGALLVFFAGTAVLFGGVFYTLSRYDLTKSVTVPASLSSVLSSGKSAAPLNPLSR